MNNNEWSLIILAAGKGTRMGGETPKPLVTVGEKRLIQPILEAGQTLLPGHTIVVLSETTAAVAEQFPGIATYVYQPSTGPAGTAAATRTGLEHVTTPCVLVCHADDSHLYTAELLVQFISSFKKPATIAATQDHLSSSYWRVEQNDSVFVDFIDPKQNQDLSVFMALYAFSTEWLRTHLKETPFPEGREQGLPFLLRQSRDQIHVRTFPAGVWHGVNTPEELAALQKLKS